MNRRYRKTIIAGNWKMNKTPSEARELVSALVPLVKDAACDVVVCTPAVDFDPLEADVFLRQRGREQGNGLGQKAVEPLPGVVPADDKFLHCPSANVSSRSIFRSARRRKNAVAHADTTSAIGKHHHTLPTFPVSDRRYAAGMSATT